MRSALPQEGGKKRKGEKRHCPLISRVSRRGKRKMLFSGKEKNLEKYKGSDPGRLFPLQKGGKEGGEARASESTMQKKRRRKADIAKLTSKRKKKP